MIRNASLADVERMLDWAAQEGWNPGLGDAQAFLAADPQGFFVAEAGGEVAACISVVNHSDSHAFLGFYIAQAAFRGQGIAFELWREAMKHAGDRTVGLDGVADQQENYARSGFVRSGATLRLEGPRPEAEADGIRAFTARDLDAVAALDTQANGVARPRFLREWVKDTGSRRTLVLDDGRGVAGFATARLCRAGCKIGPVVAPDAAAALALAAAAAGALRASDVVIDVPDAQPGFVGILKRRGFAETFGTARMYRGTPPAASGRLFGIATMELG
ncbi:N-acetyltransferase GCN5 [Pseudooceanicola nanhaiensis]|uniref:N-acetyltransferase GCN5 n=1 Tax=Pseudooceanicola nanhaiensis TaxID=375761 RepID=A0A917WHK3_9RHOB|nr:GNAT family N-acetyltransferase [Pseudooceanicola nanhaiensis]GGM04664.1 N-acetyltransferase GCN5 [Pseudooceanicola nanhaiensis]